MIPESEATAIISAAWAKHGQNVPPTVSLSLLLSEVVNGGYSAGLIAARGDLLTLSQASEKLEMHPASVRGWAARLKIGWRPEHNYLLLSSEDVEVIARQSRSGKRAAKEAAAAMAGER